MESSGAAISLGPILFNWQPEAWRDFYFRIADQAPVDTVYVGEVVCSKRSVLFEPYFEEVAERLKAAGKTVVYSTLSEVMLKLDRQVVDSVCGLQDSLIEANDGSSLAHLSGKPHHVGPFVNAYNEGTISFLARKGARNFCLPAELPATAIRVLCERAANVGATIEVQAFGRISLALSARCYHARAHGRTKDSCQFVCENDPDGMELRTLDNRPFLAVNGIQTLSFEYLNLINELDDLRAMGVSRFRLSPHSCDMVAVASIFRSVLDRRIALAEGLEQLKALNLGAPFSNGFYHGVPGHQWVAAGSTQRTPAKASTKTLELR
ncbi:MAG: U32 family peptidase [Bradyrhizobiaceae bacterium]|nr:U32 family peptidase [Bradyrhizobiaceae bacterium]